MKNDDGRVWSLVWDCHLSAAIATWMRQNTHTHTYTFCIGSLNLSIIVVVVVFVYDAVATTESKYARRTQALEDWKQHDSNCVLHFARDSIVEFEKGKIISIRRWHTTHANKWLYRRVLASFFLFCFHQNMGMGDARLLSATITDISFDSRAIRKFLRLPNARALLRVRFACMCGWVCASEWNSRE